VFKFKILTFILIISYFPIFLRFDLGKLSLFLVFQVKSVFASGIYENLKSFDQTYCNQSYENNKEVHELDILIFLPMVILNTIMLIFLEVNDKENFRQIFDLRHLWLF